MDPKVRIIRSLRSATSDQELLNRRILRLRKSFREVEKQLNRGRRKEI
ncbi:MAG: hypothetical protein LUE65_12785 [Clostridiales bacterium]|nr:hypothetical protein [Clostridiales bacterium]